MKVSIFIEKSLKNLDFGHKLQFRSKFSKISTLVNTYKNIDFGENFRNLSYRRWSKLSKNLGISENFRNVAILVKKIENLDFGQNFRKFHLQSKFSKNFDFGQNFLKGRYWSTISKLLILVKKIPKHLDFWSKLLQT